MKVGTDHISSDTTGLEVQVHIEVNVVISFGLEIFTSIFCFIAIALEVSIKNQSLSLLRQEHVFGAKMRSCGVSGPRKLQPKREINVYKHVLLTK